MNAESNIWSHKDKQSDLMSSDTLCLGHKVPPVQITHHTSFTSEQCTEIVSSRNRYNSDFKEEARKWSPVFLFFLSWLKGYTGEKQRLGLISNEFITLYMTRTDFRLVINTSLCLWNDMKPSASQQLSIPFPESKNKRFEKTESSDWHIHCITSTMCSMNFKKRADMKQKME